MERQGARGRHQVDWPCGHRWQKGNSQGTGVFVDLMGRAEVGHPTCCFCFSSSERGTYGGWAMECRAGLAGHRDVQGAQNMGDCWAARSPLQQVMRNVEWP